MSTDVPRTIGRCEELALLRKSVAAAVDSGSGQALEILGEPGIGKTHLLSELSLIAAESGIPVIAARATQLQHTVLYGLVTEVLTAPPRYLPVAQRRELRTWADDALARIFSAHSQPAHQCLALHQIIRTAIEDLAAPHGLVITLDDIHWADPASADVLQYLLTHPPAARVLLAITCRPRQLGVPLAAALNHAASQDQLTTIELGPLAREDASALIGTCHSLADRDVLHARSGGNPQYLKALLHLHAAGERLPSGRCSPAELPRALDTELRAELAPLAQSVRLVAESAAVLGDHVTPKPLAVVAELTLPEVLSALDELTQLDILRADPCSPSFAFRHPVLRAVVYRWAPAGWKIGAHTRAADYLAEHDAPAAARAPHLAQSASHGDLEAVTVLTQAASDTRGSAPNSAAGWYAAALRLLPDNSQHHAHRLDLLGCLRQRLTCGDAVTPIDIGADTVPAPRGTANPHGKKPPGTPRSASLDTLSPREREVAQLIAHGDTNRDIARVLDIKENTVEVHVGHILRKLGVRSRASVAGIIAVHGG